VFVAPAAVGPPRNLTGSREETAQSIAWRPDGRLAVSRVAGTRTAVDLVDPATGAWLPVLAPGAVAFTAPAWSADGSRYAFAGSTSEHPPDVYAGALAPAKGQRGAAEAPRRLVRSNPQLDALPRGAQETFRYAAGDGLQVEAVLVRPPGFREGTRYPLVVIVHGGPESQFLDAWQNGYLTPAHALAERGFLVFFPNYRGSTGRGVAYSKADHRDLGGRELQDVLDGVDALASRGWIDPARVGITGGSYGGYFTALAVTRHSDRFATGVDAFGITNWESFLGQTDIPEENALVHWALWCYEHAALCRERSPIGNLDRARTPTLILQGEKDLRVPRAQSDELYAALRYKGVPVEYVVYPRERHGFVERWHRIDAFTRLRGWMDEHLSRKH
jgi:dipeptidyl aminopeptidase/acylaminoacyl peptidase